MRLIFRITNLMRKVLQQGHEIFIIVLNEGYQNHQFIVKLYYYFKNNFQLSSKKNIRLHLLPFH